MASDTVDPIDWPLPPPYTGAVPRHLRYWLGSTIQCGPFVNLFSTIIYRVTDNDVWMDLTLPITFSANKIQNDKIFESVNYLS